MMAKFAHAYMHDPVLLGSNPELHEETTRISQLDSIKYISGSATVTRDQLH